MITLRKLSLTVFSSLQNFPIASSLRIMRHESVTCVTLASSDPCETIQVFVLTNIGFLTHCVPPQPASFYKIFLFTSKILVQRTITLCKIRKTRYLVEIDIFLQSFLISKHSLLCFEGNGINLWTIKVEKFYSEISQVMSECAAGNSRVSMDFVWFNPQTSQ